jgi:flagellar hook-associated protein 3 FlgL
VVVAVPAKVYWPSYSVLALQINTDISQLLGNGGSDGKLLSVLDSISQDLQSGTSAGQNNLGTTDLNNLDSSIQTLQGLQATVGASQDRLQLASARIQDLQVSDTQTLSNTEDADMAQTAINYSTAQAAYNAALQATASIVQDSLLNFLQ